MRIGCHHNKGHPAISRRENEHLMLSDLVINLVGYIKEKIKVKLDEILYKIDLNCFLTFLTASAFRIW